MTTKKKQPPARPAAPSAAPPPTSPQAAGATSSTTLAPLGSPSLEPAVQPPTSIELQTARTAALAKAQMETSRIIALQRPRNIDQVYEALMHQCRRSTFAENVAYAYPRGGERRCRHNWHNNSCTECDATLITGASVYLAREAARLFKNLWVESPIVLEDGDVERLIEARVFDLEANFYRSSQARFKKVVYRRDKGWIPADERELRELTNRQAAFAERNAILQLLPRDLVDDALSTAETTLAKRATEDPDAERKKIIDGFNRVNVSVAQLEQFLGHKVAECSPAELGKLRGIWKSIMDGASRWADYVDTESAEARRNPPKDEPKQAPADNASGSPQPPNAAGAPGGDDLIGTSQPLLGLFWGIAKRAGFNEETAHAELKAQFGYDSVKAIPKGRTLDAVIEHFVAAGKRRQEQGG